MVTLTSMAEEILVYARQIDDHLASKGLPSPSFDHDTLESLPDHIALARDHLVDTTQSLKQLSQGGIGRATEIAMGVRP